MVSTFKGAAQLGATAVALGLSLTLPCGVASAEDSQPDSPTSSVAATSDSGVRKSATARRPARETRTTNEAAAPRSAPSAASRSAPSAASRTAASRTNRARPESPAAVARTALPGGAAADRKSAALNTPAGPDQPDSAPTAAPARDAPGATPPTLRRAPRAAAVAGTASAPLTAGALAAATDPFSALLSPIQGLLEGVGLLIRRTLFNQAPSVSPVQITGKSTGPITGTIGASDPEGDPIVYSVTRNAQYGRVTVGSDGSYTYTPGEEFTGTDTFTVAATDTGFHINLLDLFRAASTPAMRRVRSRRVTRTRRQPSAAKAPPASAESSASMPTARTSTGSASAARSMAPRRDRSSGSAGSTAVVSTMRSAPAGKSASV